MAVSEAIAADLTSRKKLPRAFVGETAVAAAGFKTSCYFCWGVTKGKRAGG